MYSQEVWWAACWSVYVITLTTSELVNQKCPTWEQSPWCPCYQFEDGLFMECSSTGLVEVQQTLSLISSSIKSLSIFHLNENVKRLPHHFFSNCTVSHLQISFTQIQHINSRAFANLESSLESLSIINSQLTKVPTDALNDLRALRVLDLDTNNINEIVDYQFYGLPLTYINLQNNIIESFAENSLDGLEDTLEELIIAGNNLITIPLMSLRYLNKLKILKMNGNSVKEIGRSEHFDLPNLRRLDLSNNKITKIYGNAFQTMARLESLSLDMNLLESLEEIFHMPELQSLNVSHNNLMSLPSNVFASAPNLRLLDLSFNHLHFIPIGVFHNLTYLKEMFLANNNIMHVDNDTFLNTNHIMILSLENNAISNLSIKAFNSLYHLTHLHLSYNLLRKIHPKIFDHNRELLHLYLDHNLLSEISATTFEDTADLKVLKLQYNSMNKIKRNVFSPLTNLEELDLRYNRIVTIETEAFQNLINLHFLNLEGNNLVMIEDILSRYPASLRFMQFSNNQINKIELNSFKGQNKVEILWLSWNKLETLSGYIFHDLVELHKVYLDHNFITAIEDDTFEGAIKLSYINLEFNYLGYLTMDMFRGAETIEELYLSNNNIMDIEPQTFQNLPKLRILHLSHNQIYIIRRYMFEGNIPLEELVLSNVMANGVEAGSFSELTLLKHLDVSNNRISSIKVDFMFSLSIQRLSLTNIPKINDNIFYGLSRLENISLENTELNLTDYLFEPLSGLSVINLNRNKIKDITIEHFSTFEFLKELYADGNEFYKIPEAVRILTKIEKLSFSDNFIAVIKNGSFRSNLDLKTLRLSNNKIKLIEKGAFIHLKKLLELDLRNNGLLIFSSSSTLPALQFLNLEENLFKNIPKDLLCSKMKKGRIIILDKNPINDLQNEEEFDEIMKCSTEELALQKCNISVIKLGDFDDFSALLNLSTRHSFLTLIVPGAFRPLNNLINLDLAYNALKTIVSGTFEGLIKLKTLDLHYNLISRLFTFGRDLQRLEYLDLSYNKLTSIKNRTFEQLSNLKTLILKNNFINWLAPDSFNKQLCLEELNLQNNRLSFINEVTLSSIEVKINRLQLSGNNLHCDCESLELKSWAMEHLNVFESPENLLCNSPDNLSNKSLYDLKADEVCPNPEILSFHLMRIDEDHVILSWDMIGEADKLILTYKSYQDDKEMNINLTFPQNYGKIENLIPGSHYIVCLLVIAHRKKGTIQNEKCTEFKTLKGDEIIEDKVPVEYVIGAAIGSSVFLLIVISVVVGFLCKRYRRRYDKNNSNSS